MYIARFDLVGVGVASSMAAFAVIAGVAFFFQRHKSEGTSAQIAQAEFQHLRARFAARAPATRHA